MDASGAGCAEAFSWSWWISFADTLRQAVPGRGGKMRGRGPPRAEARRSWPEASCRLRRSPTHRAVPRADRTPRPRPAPPRAPNGRWPDRVRCNNRERAPLQSPQGARHSAAKIGLRRGRRCCRAGLSDETEQNLAAMRSSEIEGVMSAIEQEVTRLQSDFAGTTTKMNQEQSEKIARVASPRAAAGEAVADIFAYERIVIGPRSSRHAAVHLGKTAFGARIGGVGVRSDRVCSIL